MQAASVVWSMAVTEPAQSFHRPVTRSEAQPVAFPAHLRMPRVLGEGGSAIVYRAFDSYLGVHVAIKVPCEEKRSDRHARQRLLQEATLHARLDSPCLPAIYDVDELPDGTPYMVMEEVRGPTLAELITQGRLRVDFCCETALKLLDALKELHLARVVHLDIKPSNLILEYAQGRPSRVRILDLGIARSIVDGAVDLPWQEGLAGTPHYMSPEQLSGHGVDTRTDLYAVGVVLYELLSRHTPFSGTTVSDVIASVLRDEPLAVSTLRDDLPEGLAQVVACAMAKSRDRRFQSAEAMSDALRAVMRRHSEFMTSCERIASMFHPRTPAPPRSHRRRSPLRVGITCGLTLLALASLGVPARAYDPPVASSGYAE